MYGTGILVGAALGFVGGVTGLILAYSVHGLVPLFAPATLGAFLIGVLSVLAPIVSIVAAIASFKKQLFGQIWASEIAGILMYGSGLCIVGMLSTGGLTLVPAAASALGGLILLAASDELKTPESA